MKYSLTILALLSLSTAACIPKDYNSAEPLCPSTHVSASISSITHTKPKHSRHQKHTKHKHPSAATNTTNPSHPKSTNTQIPPILVPQFGIQPGIDPSHGNCKGLNNILIPCACPPSRDAFIAKMVQFVSAGNAEGTPVSFPLDDSLDSQITRLTTSIVTLQNFNGRPGSGCPASSTTFVGQRAKLLAKL